MTELENVLAQHIATHILPGSLAGDILRSESLFDDGYVDSLGLQQILVHIETEFSIDVGEDDLMPDNFDTVTGIAALVTRLQSD